MEDTTPAIQEKVREMMQSKTSLERLMMGCSMYETSKYLVTQFILAENPNISKIALKQELFLKFYGEDFNPEDRNKILKHFEQIGERQLDNRG